MFYSNSETVDSFRQFQTTTCYDMCNRPTCCRIILCSVIVTMVNDKIKNKNTQTFQFFGIFVSPFFHRAALHLSVVHTSVCVYIYRFHCRRVFRAQWRASVICIDFDDFNWPGDRRWVRRPFWYCSRSHPTSEATDRLPHVACSTAQVTYVYATISIIHQLRANSV